MSVRPGVVLLLVVVGVLAIIASRNRPNVREGWTLVTALGVAGVTASMLPGVLDGYTYETSLGTFVDGFGADGIEFALRVDELGMIFALVSSSLYLVTAIYSIGYMRGNDEHDQTRFFAMLCLSVGAALGVAFAGNLLVLLIFYEVLTLATYPLVAHEETEEARVSGYKYLAYALTGGLAIFAGMVATVWVAGDVSFTRGGIEGLSTLADDDPWTARAIFALLAGGFFVKAGVMPTHAWLPSAMVAPTPVSGLLHAVAVVKAGAFGVARTVFDVFGPETVSQLGLGVVVVVFASSTILIASLFALRQDNLKARLAYSTIAQLSYIVLGLGILAPAALMGALLHIPAHAFAKLTLFLCAGALYVQLDVKYISQMPGVARRMPVTMTAFAIAAFSMAGLPLFAGFVSKWHLLIGSADAGYLPVTFVLITSGALNVAYFWPIVYTAFFESPGEHGGKPLLGYPFGGKFVSSTPGKKAKKHKSDETALTDGGETPDKHEDEVQDKQEDEAPDKHEAHDEDGGSTTVTDKSNAEWDRPESRFGETTLLMLVPIMVTGTLVLLFGIGADYSGFFELIETIVEEATVGDER